jgi:hypothetical protein
MHTPTRLLAPTATLLSGTALALGMLAPVAASAHGAGGDRSALRAEREQLRATRSEERVARAQERRAERQQERAARKATREEERAARRSARRGEAEASTEQGTSEGATASGSEKESSTSTGPVAPAASATPSAAELKKCSATIESSSSRITAGETVTIFGKLTCPAGVSVAERQIAVSQGRQGTPAADYTVLGVATTEADGSYEIASPAFDANTTFRVLVGHHGARAVVKVAPVVTLSGPSPAAMLSTAGGRTPGARPARAVFTGTVKPGDAGGRVALQVAYAESGEAWRTVSFATVDADGSYSVTHRFRTAGQASVRVLVHMRGRNVVAASEPLSYEVAQAQNPKLTILSSAAPVTYGQPATIGGIAAEAPNQTITLLARTHAGNFAPVATTTSDANGSYSFPQAPTQSTYYRVSAGAIYSTVLYEGVKRALTLDPPPGATQAGQQATFTGSVTPADEGQTVYAERQNASGIGFHIVASATIGASGYSIAHVFANAGSYTLRIRVPGDPALQTVTSAPFDFEVIPAAAATLTPEAPALTPLASPAS